MVLRGLSPARFSHTLAVDGVAVSTICQQHQLYRQHPQLDHLTRSSQSQPGSIGDCPALQQCRDQWVQSIRAPFHPRRLLVTWSLGLLAAFHGMLLDASDPYGRQRC